MIAHKKHGLVAAGVLLMFNADLVCAQQEIKEVGRDVLMRQNQVFELEKRHIVLLINEKGVSITDDPSSHSI